MKNTQQQPSFYTVSQVGIFYAHNIHYVKIDLEEI